MYIPEAKSSQASKEEGPIVKPAGSKVKPTPTEDLDWEWENDKGVWTKYKQEHSDDLTKALSHGENSVVLQVTPAVQLNIRFSSMTQMNVSTGWQRDIRCTLKGAGCDRWEWQDENGKWNAYSPTIQRLLVACELCGCSEQEVEAAGRKYHVDLVSKKQVNLETEVERKMRQHTASEVSG